MISAVFALLAAPAGPADALFAPAGPLPVLRITVDDVNLQLLRRDDRKYVRATLRVDGEPTLRDIGLHLKGAAGSRRSWDDKPGLTLNTDKFVKGQKFRGLDKLHLNNGVQDGSFMNELLANELAAALGLPSCRCTHALVELNTRKVGLYVLKEGFDKSWLERNFADAKGNLYDGEFKRDLDQPLKLDVGNDNGRADLKAVVKACQEGDANKRYAAVEKLVDVDRFATYVAFEIITADWDGYPRGQNNYRVYFDPKAGGKAVFIAHGLDQVFQNPHEGVWPGWSGMVARAIMDHPEGKKKLVARLNEIIKDPQTVARLLRRADELSARVVETLKQTNKGAIPGFEGEVKTVKERIRQRFEYLGREVPKMK